MDSFVCFLFYLCHGHLHNEYFPLWKFPFWVRAPILCHSSIYTQFPFLVTTIQFFPHCLCIYTCRWGLLLLSSFPPSAGRLSLYFPYKILSSFPPSAVTLTGYEPGLCTLNCPICLLLVSVALSGHLVDLPL